MPSITRETVIKHQAQAPDGWKFDWKHYVIWGEKTLVRYIPVYGDQIMIARLAFDENAKEIEMLSGRFHYIPCGTYHIGLHVGVYRDNGSVLIGGMEKYINMDHSARTRRSYSDLCHFARALSDQEIRKLHYAA